MLGKILDPLADKLMVASALIMLAALDRPGEPSVPAWLVVVILARESAVTIIRGIALSDGIVMHAETLGKYKFILQSYAIVGLLVHYRYWGFDFFVAGMYFLVLSGRHRGLVRGQLPRAVLSPALGAQRQLIRRRN